jgi:O-antigen/teichoic acid export membrane protein
LTRLLFPEAFGAVATASALISGLILVTDVGVQAAIVQSPNGADTAFLRSAWVFQVGRGIIIWAALVCLCGILSIPAVGGLLPHASIYADRQLPLITIVIGFGVILGGAESTCIPLNVRLINYRPIVVVGLLSKFISLPVMILLALTQHSVWALVGGGLTGGFVRLVLSHLIVPGPSMAFKWQKLHFQEIIRFGRWVMISSLATFFSLQCDIIVLGILTPASTVGLYSIAKLLANIGTGLLDRLSGALALPVFGEVIRTDSAAFARQYYRFRLPIEIAAGLISGCLFIAGGFIVNFLYDDRYMQAGIMLQVLALGAITYPMMVIGSAFTATGDSYISAITSTVDALSMITFLTVGFLIDGLLGAIAGIALHSLVPSAVILTLAKRRNWVWLWHEFRVVLAFIVGAILGKALLMASLSLGIRNVHQILHLLR